jgi:integrase
MTISFYLTRPKALIYTSIFARISYHGYRIKFYIPEQISPEFWNPKTHRAKQTAKFRQYPEFNARLDDIRDDIKNAFRRWVNDNDGNIPDPETLKQLLHRVVRKLKPKNEAIHSFLAYFDDFNTRSKNGTRINPKTKKGIVNNTTKGFISTLSHIKAFQKAYKRKIDFNTIDLEFYNDYINYLTNKLTLSSNTIGDHIKRIKTVLNEATEKGINKNFAFRSKYFAKPSEEAESIYLTETEIVELEELDLSRDPKLEKVRDLFLIACYTGLRYSDYSILKPEHIKGGFIEISQIKTGGKIVIPIHDKVRMIIEKYDGKLPSLISNQKTNDYLKELGKRLPSLNAKISKTSTKGGLKVTKNFKKWELLSSHTGRRSFATNEYLAGTPSITIKAITGHKTEEAFLRYIKLTPNEHAILLKQHWDKRNKLKAV